MMMVREINLLKKLIMWQLVNEKKVIKKHEVTTNLMKIVMIQLQKIVFQEIQLEVQRLQQKFMIYN
jgi:hypothetical protein